MARTRHDGQGTTTKTKRQETHAILASVKKDSARYFKEWCEQYSAKVRNLRVRLKDGRNLDTKADAQGPNSSILIWADNGHVLQLVASDIKTLPAVMGSYLVKK